jgi:polysaccharide export outer membrane protein
MKILQTIVRACGGFAIAVLLSACAATGVEPVEAVNDAGKEMIAEPLAQAQPQTYRFHPGDELAIRAVNRPELTLSSVRVDPYGNISFPYLGDINVRNLSPSEVSDRLSRGLLEGGYYTRTEFSVSLVSSKGQYVYVLGEVKSPGPIAITGNIPLLAAIGRAGGQTYNAEMSTVLWIRGGLTPPGVVKFDMNALGDPRAKDAKVPNIVLAPGDIVYIPDSVIASIERFFGRMYNIFRAILVLEQGIAIYPDVEDALANRTRGGGGNTVNIVFPP